MSGVLLFTGTAGNLFQNMHVVKIGGDLDANSEIVNYFHGIIAGLSVSFIFPTNVKYFPIMY